MPRAHVIAFCLAFIGAYGVLYAIHASRNAAHTIYELESRVDEDESKVHDLESEMEDIKSTVADLEGRRY